LIHGRHEQGDGQAGYNEKFLPVGNVDQISDWLRLSLFIVFFGFFRPRT